MDLLRRIFGLHPAPSSATPAPSAPEGLHAPPEDLDGPTAPLEGTAGRPPFQPGSVKGMEENGRTRRLPDLDTNLPLSGDRAGRHLVFGLKSDVGQVRTNNQDAILAFSQASVMANQQPEFGLFIVADGMGGHHDGEHASATAARTVAHYTSSQIFLPMLQQEEVSSEKPTITEILRTAIQKANESVSKRVPEGGTTVTAVAIVGDLAYIGHVGDSRAYLLNEDGIEQLTRDHSLVQRLIELDQLTPEEAAEHPQRNVLYRAIGQNENIDVDAITRRLTPGTRLLICTDGLWNLVPEEEIKNTVFSSPNPQVACDALVKLANARGGPDNISVVIIKAPE